MPDPLFGKITDEKLQQSLLRVEVDLDSENSGPVRLPNPPQKYPPNLLRCEIARLRDLGR